MLLAKSICSRGRPTRRSNDRRPSVVGPPPSLPLPFNSMHRNCPSVCRSVGVPLPLLTSRGLQTQQGPSRHRPRLGLPSPPPLHYPLTLRAPRTRRGSILNKECAKEMNAPPSDALAHVPFQHSEKSWGSAVVALLLLPASIAIWCLSDDLKRSTLVNEAQDGCVPVRHDRKDKQRAPWSGRVERLLRASRKWRKIAK